MTGKILKNTKIVTFITDWGEKDFYGGAVKGKLLSLVPDVSIVDISHHIEPYNINHAGYVLKNTYPHFPKGTIHIIGVDSEEYAMETDIRSHLLVKFDDHFFIGADNGIFSLLTAEEKAQYIYELTLPFDPINGQFKYIFSTRDRFVPAAAHLLNGGDPHEIGKPLAEFKKILELQPTYTQQYINGMVVYVDRYENAIVNISEELFNKVSQGRKFKILFRNHEIHEINKQYQDVYEQNIVVLFNSAGLMEIALNKGKASSLLGLRPNDSVSIVFIDEPSAS